MRPISNKQAERKTKQSIARLFSKFPHGKEIPGDEIVAAILDMGREMAKAGCGEAHYQIAVLAVQEGFGIPDDEWKDLLKIGTEFLEETLGCKITGLN